MGWVLSTELTIGIQLGEVKVYSPSDFSVGIFLIRVRVCIGL